jgi:hypothetical protein
MPTYSVAWRIVQQNCSCGKMPQSCGEPVCAQFYEIAWATPYKPGLSIPLSLSTSTRGSPQKKAQLPIAR